VQQEEPLEAINAARLAEVKKDQAARETLRNNVLPTTTTNIYSAVGRGYIWLSAKPGRFIGG
jgi:hypothetical protein